MAPCFCLNREEISACSSFSARVSCSDFWVECDWRYLNYTREIREGSERVGFEVVTLDARKGPLTSTKTTSLESQRWPSVGKYKVDVSSFESLALPELQEKYWQRA